MKAAEPIQSLRIEGITKRFPGILACDRVSLEVHKGEVLALVGENGAGKSTLMNILAGLYQPDEGTLFINDWPVHFRTPSDAFARGIGMVHQNFMLVPNMTVAENVALGSKHLHKFMNLDLKGARRRIQEVSEHHELPVNPDAYIWQLSVGEQQRVELVKTLCFGAQLLILDEPTSALTTPGDGRPPGPPEAHDRRALHHLHQPQAPGGEDPLGPGDDPPARRRGLQRRHRRPRRPTSWRR